MPVPRPAPLLPLTSRLVALALCWAAAPLLAQPAPAGASAQVAPQPGSTAWTDLTPAQREALAPLAGDWNRLPEDKRRKWQEVATRFPRMTPAQQQRVQQRMSEWAQMTPQQRDRARLNFQSARQWSPDERQARWEAYQALSPEERQALAAARKASAPPSATQALRKAPVDAQAPKSNLVRAPDPAALKPKPVAPVIVQGNPGASTLLINQRRDPPAHQQVGQPKITASPSQVDPVTLLPRPPASAP